MPSKKKKYNSRFPPARIKRIMQADEEVGKVAAVVPVIISRTLEIFVETLLKKASDVTRSRNARTLTPAHLKASINSESQFRFLREMVATISDIQPTNEDDISDAPTNTNSLSNARGIRRAVSRCPSSNSKGKGRQPRKSSGSRPRVVSQEDVVSDDEEDEDNEETDEEEEGDVDLRIGSIVTEDRVVGTSNIRPALIMDHVSLPVVDDDYDNL